MTGLVWRIDLYYTHTFMGADYEVVNGSRRDHAFKKARIARTMGDADMSIYWHLVGIRSPGCAHAHRLGVRHG